MEDLPNRQFMSRRGGRHQLNHLQPLLQLRLVCKAFNAAIPHHIHELTLPEEFSSSTLPSLLAWLHRSKPSLVSLNADCQSPVVEAVLAALACSSMPLRKIWIVYASICVIDLVSTFDNLVECALHSYNEGPHDLGPLQVLPHLADLILTSSFIGLEQLAHLTRLSLETLPSFMACISKDYLLVAA